MANSSQSQQNETNNQTNQPLPPASPSPVSSSVFSPSIPPSPLPIPAPPYSAPQPPSPGQIQTLPATQLKRGLNAPQGELKQSENVQFRPQPVSIGHDEIVVNKSANKDYIQLTGLTTTTTHTNATKLYLGNPYYQNIYSRLNYDGIEGPGAEKLKSKLLSLHNVVEQATRSKFVRGDMNHDAESLIGKMYSDGESLVRQPLQIRKVEFLRPSNTAPEGFRKIDNVEHIGVRGVLTNKRLLLIDSTEDSVSELTKPTSQYVEEMFQRKLFGLFKIRHKIMHDFWFKDILLEDIAGSEFHFSHFSDSSKVLKRFHHPISIFLLFFSIIMALLGVVLVGDRSNEVAMIVSFVFSFIFLIAGSLVYNYMSILKPYITESEYGKNRIIKIGYFDQLHNDRMVLLFHLEDGQELEKSVEWLSILQESCKLD